MTRGQKLLKSPIFYGENLYMIWHYMHYYCSVVMNIIFCFSFRAVLEQINSLVRKQGKGYVLMVLMVAKHVKNYLKIQTIIICKLRVKFVLGQMNLGPECVL